MRKDILPQLAEQVNHTGFGAFEDRPKFTLQSCMNSGKKERSQKPKLRRLHLEDTVSQGSTQRRDSQTDRSTEVVTPYGLRPRKRTYGAIAEKTGNSKTFVPSIKGTRGSESDRLNVRGNGARAQGFSPAWFGSAKKARKSRGIFIDLLVFVIEGCKTTLKTYNGLNAIQSCISI